MRFLSPLRYPGGKAALAGFLADAIELNDLDGGAYYEPYAGGAGAALNLLREGVVSELFLNDADRRIYAFWNSVLYANERFVDHILSIPLTIDEWHRQNVICTDPRGHSRFEIGFAAFYMNRCNRSGVITKSGPIGGYAQAGKWRMDVRFNRERLAEQVIALKKMRQSIHVFCKDAIEFLKLKLPKGRGRSRVFVYLDPPYVSNGSRLYLNAYDEADHAILASYMEAQSVLPWIMSYDDSDLVRELYSTNKMALLTIQYSLQAKRTSRELIIAPRHVAIPKACRGNGTERLLSALN